MRPQFRSAVFYGEKTDLQIENSYACNPNIGGGPFNSLRRLLMLWTARPVSINEQVGINSCHWDLLIILYQVSRSAASIPGGKPPGTVTQRIESLGDLTF